LSQFDEHGDHSSETVFAILETTETPDQFTRFFWYLVPSIADDAIKTPLSQKLLARLKQINGVVVSDSALTLTRLNRSLSYRAVTACEPRE